jgi:hypothetical protein
MIPRVPLGRAVAVWLLMMSIETVHGVLRATVLVQRVGDLPARQIGVLTGSLLILAVTYLALGWLRLDGARQRIAVGIVWAALTLAFELVLGRFVLGYPWSRLAADYDVANGGLMGLGLLLMVFAPSIASAFATRGTMTDQTRGAPRRPSHTLRPGGSLRRAGH